jgi:excisionase family DNA binding protein
MATQPAERRALTPQEAAYALNLGESKTRELYQTGRLQSVRVGRRVLIPSDAIDQFLATAQAPNAACDKR